MQPMLRRTIFFDQSNDLLFFPWPITLLTIALVVEAKDR